jgi:quinol monooxygenase YgiN
VVHVLTRAEVRDFDTFWQVFQTRGHELRTRHGSSRARVFRDAENPNVISVLFDWESRARFEEFLQDPETREAMQAAGLLAPPEYTFLEAVGELDG